MKKVLTKTAISSFVLGLYFTPSWAQQYSLRSPDQKTVVSISVADEVKWSVQYDNALILKPSRIALELSSGEVLGNKAVVQKATPITVSRVIEAPVPIKNRLIPEQFNQLQIRFKANYTLVFRAYNDGVAYRFETSLPAKEVIVKNEIAEFNFQDNCQIAWPTDEPFSFGRPGMAIPEPGFGSVNPPAGLGPMGPPPVGPAAGDRGNRPSAPPMMMARRSPFNTSYEYLFRDSTLAAVGDTVGLPIYVSTGKGVKVVLLEADLYDYPNLFVKGNRNNLLTAALPAVVLKEQNAGPMSRISETADYIARTTGSRTYPWRAIAISADDKGLLENELVYKLSTAPAVATDWIQPGQVAWDWWHGSNLYNVDFKAGINTASYKYYIDFAAKYGVKYILIDAGWSNNKDVDIPAVTAYASQKNVGVMLWVAWRDLLPTIESTLDTFQNWGIKGVKMDYMDRADQAMVNIFEKVAIETAKRKMLIDFHGAYKPVGLHRKYPNVINYEGVKGLEHNKLGSSRITPSHDVVLLFTRMVAGPMDYTPGALQNASNGNFRNVSSEPMSQGTRAHQAAMYILYDAPIQMLADNPSTHLKEDEYTKFITSIPTVWDKTIALDGKIGQYGILARQRGNNWYIGALTDWSNREFMIDLNFLDNKKYRVTILEDGTNADKHGSDYILKSTQLVKGDKLKISMNKGGGWAAIVSPDE